MRAMRPVRIRVSAGFKLLEKLIVAESDGLGFGDGWLVTHAGHTFQNQRADRKHWRPDYHQ